MTLLLYSLNMKKSFKLAKYGHIFSCFNVVKLIFMNTYLLCIPVMLYRVQFSRSEGKKNGIKQWKE